MDRFGIFGENFLFANTIFQAMDKDKQIKIISHSKEEVRCGICLGLLKEDVIKRKCSCGAIYHESCAIRVKNCPLCNSVFEEKPKEEQTQDLSVMNENDLPNKQLEVEEQPFHELSNIELRNWLITAFGFGLFLFVLIHKMVTEKSLFSDYFPTSLNAYNKLLSDILSMEINLAIVVDFVLIALGISLLIFGIVLIRNFKISLMNFVLFLVGLLLIVLTPLSYFVYANEVGDINKHFFGITPLIDILLFIGGVVLIIIAYLFIRIKQTIPKYQSEEELLSRRTFLKDAVVLGTMGVAVATVGAQAISMLKTLKPKADLEKDAEIKWKPPFPTLNKEGILYWIDKNGNFVKPVSVEDVKVDEPITFVWVVKNKITNWTEDRKILARYDGKKHKEDDWGEFKKYLAKANNDLFYCHTAVCTHLGCTIGWHPDKERFISPCHFASFDKTGQKFTPPAPKPLEVYKVEIIDGNFKITEED